MSEKIYLEMTKETRSALEKVAAGKDWSFKQLKNVLVQLARSEFWSAVPATHRPDSINALGLAEVILKLAQKTLDTGKEHSRPVFIDKQREVFVVGKTVVGTEDSVHVDRTPQPGRELEQKRSITIHTHPFIEGNFGGHGFSEHDYDAFLNNVDEQMMIITFGKDMAFLVMKTSTTPNLLRKEDIARRIAENAKDFLKNRSIGPMEAIVQFNKAICTEFGLTMYRANGLKDLHFKRVSVAD